MSRVKCPRGQKPVTVCLPEAEPTRFAGVDQRGNFEATGLFRFEGTAGQRPSSFILYPRDGVLHWRFQDDELRRVQIEVGEFLASVWRSELRAGAPLSVRWKWGYAATPPGYRSQWREDAQLILSPQTREQLAVWLDSLEEKGLAGSQQLGTVLQTNDKSPGLYKYITFKKVKFIPNEYMRGWDKRTTSKRTTFTIKREWAGYAQVSVFCIENRCWYMTQEVLTQLRKLGTGATVLIANSMSYALQLQPEDLDAYNVWLDSVIEAGIVGRGGVPLSGLGAEVDRSGFILDPENDFESFEFVINGQPAKSDRVRVSPGGPNQLLWFTVYLGTQWTSFTAQLGLWKHHQNFRSTGKLILVNQAPGWSTLKFKMKPETLARFQVWLDQMEEQGRLFGLGADFKPPTLHKALQKELRAPKVEVVTKYELARPGDLLNPFFKENHTPSWPTKLELSLNVLYFRNPDRFDSLPGYTREIAKRAKAGEPFLIDVDSRTMDDSLLDSNYMLLLDGKLWHVPSNFHKLWWEMLDRRPEAVAAMKAERWADVRVYIDEILQNLRPLTRGTDFRGILKKVKRGGVKNVTDDGTLLDKSTSTIQDENVIMYGPLGSLATMFYGLPPETFMVYVFDTPANASAYREHLSNRGEPLLYKHQHMGANFSAITEVMKRAPKGTIAVFRVAAGTEGGWEKNIYVDMMTVAKGWQRHGINSAMMRTFEKEWPGRKVEFSSPTHAGRAFIAAHGGKAISKDFAPEYLVWRDSVEERGFAGVVERNGQRYLTWKAKSKRSPKQRRLDVVEELPSNLFITKVPEALREHNHEYQLTHKSGFKVLSASDPDLLRDFVVFLLSIPELKQIYDGLPDGPEAGEAWEEKWSSLPMSVREPIIFRVQSLKESGELKGVRDIPDGKNIDETERDYSAILSPELRQQGYSIIVEDKDMLSAGNNRLTVYAMYKDKSVGRIIGSKRGNSVVAEDVSLDEEHRSKGLGKAMYEALYREGYNLGARVVRGGTHSSLAHNVHMSLSNKHGWYYDAVPNSEEYGGDWPEEQWADIRGKPDRDDRWKGYSFPLKGLGAAHYGGEVGIVEMGAKKVTARGGRASVVVTSPWRALVSLWIPTKRSTKHTQPMLQFWELSKANAQPLSSSDSEGATGFMAFANLDELNSPIRFTRSRSGFFEASVVDVPALLVMVDEALQKTTSFSGLAAPQRTANTYRERGIIYMRVKGGTSASGRGMRGNPGWLTVRAGATWPLKDEQHRALQVTFHPDKYTRDVVPATTWLMSNVWLKHFSQDLPPAEDLNVVLPGEAQMVVSISARRDEEGLVRTDALPLRWVTVEPNNLWIHLSLTKEQRDELLVWFDEMQTKGMLT